MRREFKGALGLLPSGSASGCTVLIYHRIGGGSVDERDVSLSDFEAQVDVLSRYDVLSLDDALDRLERGDDSPSVVLNFDDGFRDLYENAWPLLSKAGLPFTLYLATAYVGGTMHWEGSTAKNPGPGLTWEQIEEMAASGLMTVGAHTHHHVRPERLTVHELDLCDAAIESRLGHRPRHFTYPWGIPALHMEDELRRRYRSSSMGQLGRNLPGADFTRLRRVPVRRTDPIGFYRAKLRGDLWPERVYATAVGAAKAAGIRG
jgi:peptidoglycan/xylan/chitin deacetylase (PgdA/CDA1 family)